MRPSELAVVARVRGELRSGVARRARVAAGVSAAEVARVLCVSRAAVGAWEKAERVPTAVHALAYGRLLAALAGPAA